MKLEYSSLKDDDRFIVTDFSCAKSLGLLSSKDLYKIVWYKEPSQTIKVDGYPVTIAENEVIFLTPLNVLELPQEIDGLISFVFNKEFFCIQTHDDQVSCNGFLFYGSARPQSIVLENEELGRFETMLEMFKEDLLTQDYLQGEMLRSLLKRLLIKSTRIARQGLPEPSITNPQLDIIREYNLLVEQHFREFHHVKDYAKLLFKSPKTLSNLFPKYSDQSPLMVINNRIILEAKRLLVYTNRSTIEIAAELGYNDSSHFSKFFKKHTGKSPTAFRKEKLTRTG